MQTSSSKRSKTTRRGLFLLFEYNNWIQITAFIVSEVDEKIRESYMDLYCLTTTFKQKTLLLFSVYRK
jgi:hypothetical protein